MTKLKSKKMTKSTLAIIIMGIAIVALLAFGGSFAYFTASGVETHSTAHTGYVKIKSGSTAYAHIDTALPGDDLLTNVTITPSTTESTGEYVLVQLVATIAGADGAASVTLSPTLNTGWTQVSVTGASTANATYYISGSTSSGVTFTKLTAATVAFDAITFQANDNWTATTDYAATSEYNVMDADITLTINTFAIQGNIDNATAITQLAAKVGGSTITAVA